MCTDVHTMETVKKYILYIIHQVYLYIFVGNMLLFAILELLPGSSIFVMARVDCSKFLKELGGEKIVKETNLYINLLNNFCTK